MKGNMGSCSSEYQPHWSDRMGHMLPFLSSQGILARDALPSEQIPLCPVISNSSGFLWLFKGVPQKYLWWGCRSWQLFFFFKKSVKFPENCRVLKKPSTSEDQEWLCHPASCHRSSHRDHLEAFGFTICAKCENFQKIC